MTKILYKCRSITFFIFVNIHLLVAQDVPFTCNDHAYFSHHESGGDKLYQFTPDFGFSLIKKLDFSINGIGYNSKDNFIYGLNESTIHVVRVDKNGDYLDLGMPVGLQGSNYWAGTFTKDGTMIISGGGNAWIVELDVTVSPPIILSAHQKFYANGNTGTPSFGDIAVDPISGICYTIDATTKKLATVNLSTGGVTPFGVPMNFSSNQNGALYFDASGELTAFFLKDIYKIDKTTGSEIYAGEGLDINNGIDACGCLNSIQLNKSVSASEVCAGDTVTFTFEIINNSAETFPNITFTDALPEGMSWVNVPSEILGGAVSVTTLGGSSNVLIINDLSVLSGVSTFSLMALAEGHPTEPITIHNQALIDGFTHVWESSIPSNNPFTTSEGDATSFIISHTPNIHMDIIAEESGCENAPISLFADAFISGNYTWESPSGLFYDGQNYILPNATLDDAGTYQVAFVDTYGCQVDSILEVEIVPAPILNLGKDSAFCFETPFFLNAGNHVESIWQDGSTDASFFVENYGTYAVQVMNEDGCFSSDSITFTSDCPTELYVPNAFSPNGDGMNDVFLAYGVEVIDFNLKIFDRWGAFLFESNDIAHGWDGFFKGKLKQNGVYVWEIEVTFLQGKTARLKGDVTLLR